MLRVARPNSDWTINGTLRALHGVDGSPYWSVSSPAIDASSIPSIADIDYDGNPEIITLTTDFRVIAISHDGQVLWTRVIPMDGINHTITGEQTPDGGFCLGGFSEFRANGATSALVAKTDSAGTLTWFRDRLLTTTGRSFGYTVRATSDDGCILTGQTTEGSAGDLDLFLIKVDRHGQ